jgi:hypothetical protein
MSDIRTSEVCGVALDEFIDPIRYALDEYEGYFDGLYAFDLDGAARLAFVDGKLTARSQTAVTQGGEKVADLTVVAFAPHDATGDTSTFTLDQLRLSRLPDDPKYFPRSKVAVYTEAHLSLAAKKIETTDDPTLLIGSLGVLGVLGPESYVMEIGYVGHESHAFRGRIDKQRRGTPTATLTTGYERGLTDPRNPGRRFGDPHAIVNDFEGVVQVAGFVAMSANMYSEDHLQLFHLLGAKKFPWLI